jgi:RNA exonuclease 4
MCRPQILVPQVSNNEVEQKSSSRSRRRALRKNLREQDGKLGLHESSSSSILPHESSTTISKDQRTKGTKKNSEQLKKKGKKTSRNCNGQRRNRGKNHESSKDEKRRPIRSCGSSASTASLTDVSVLSDTTTTSNNIPQHIQLTSDLVRSEDFTSRFLALDCEMVGVGEDGKRSSLGRVSIVDWEGVVVFDTFVQVTEHVEDLRTFVSGIRMSDIDGSCPEKTMDLNTCIDRVKSILEGNILVGHALKNDLRALGLSHPWYDIRDTTKYDAFLKEAPFDGVGPRRIPRRLKDLAFEKLGWEIQMDGVAHSPIEDALAAMKLYQTVSPKWEKTMLYKKKRTAEIQNTQQNGATLQL